ncbi:MAG TPA: hypothetical protein ENL27_02705, partial [Candidatus Parcubacteria bacterium]|nr:hypothetical protein [Candidatus Parcubacteria bacterium]
MEDKKDKNEYDLIIIGAGPAGLTSAIYALRYNMSNLVIGEAPGGLIFETHKVCNFPTENEISGRGLANKIKNHVEFLGGEILQDRVVSARKRGGKFLVKTLLTDQEFQSRGLVLALGTEPRKLNLDKEDEFLGKGISYCPTCDGMFYKDKVVAIVGGSDSANVSSLYLADIAKKVYQIYRRDKLRGEAAWINQILENDK